MRSNPRQPRGTARLRRLLGLDGNSLRRASDRAEAWIRIGVLAALLAGGPLAAISAGQWAHQAGMAEVRADAAHAHRVHAFLLQPTGPTSDLATAAEARQVWVRARWAGAGTSPHTGMVLAPVGLATGSAVTVWVDASGRLAAPPPEPGQVAVIAVITAVITLILTALVLLAILRLIRWLLVSRRLAAWDAAWSRVEPRWTRRGP
jgi:hypothetical protein